MQDLEQCIHNTENRFCRPRNFLGIHAAGEMRMRLNDTLKIKIENGHCEQWLLHKYTFIIQQSFNIIIIFTDYAFI